MGGSLDTILAQQRASEDEPITFLLHIAHPKVRYTDRGKSALVISGKGDNGLDDDSFGMEE